jgi:NADPH:quinone reductase-like Zn-dependent oxidoreductase
VAGKAHYLKARAVLKDGGHFVSTEPSIQGILMTVLTWPLSKSGRIMLAEPSGDDLRELIHLYASGELNVTIDSTFPFEQVSQAHRRVEKGVDCGKVVLINESRCGCSGRVRAFRCRTDLRSTHRTACAVPRKIIG